MTHSSMAKESGKLQGAGVRTAESQAGMEPWIVESLSPGLIREYAERQAASRARTRHVLLELRRVLLRMNERCAADPSGAVPTEAAAQVREMAGRMYEALWLAGQATRRAAGIAADLDVVYGRGAEIQASLEMLGQVGQRTRELMSDSALAA